MDTRRQRGGKATGADKVAPPQETEREKIERLVSIIIPPSHSSTNYTADDTTTALLGLIGMFVAAVSDEQGNYPDEIFDLRWETIYAAYRSSDTHNNNAEAYYERAQKIYIKGQHR